VRNKRARAEIRELQAVNRERTRFVSQVSHELRNPLTSIVAFTDILSANQTDNLTPQQGHALSVIQKSAERLDALIGDLLDLSRMEAGDFGLDVTEMDVRGFLEEIFDAQQPIFSGAGQTLVLNGPEQRCTVVADQLRLTQVIANLLSNASKYSPAGTTVKMEAAIYGARLDIVVEDNGPGIPESQVEKVFDAFYRVDNETTRSVPGTGLGLAIARRITEMHGGEISLESAQGKGTKVTVSLPGVTVRDEGAAPVPQADVTADSPRPKRRRQSPQT
jgi:signal transduction histidine kinase